MDKENIRKSARKIREESEKIEQEVEDKRVETRGDPVVKIH